jgi:hypothetical protein
MQYSKVSKATVVSLGVCLLFFAAVLAQQKAKEPKEKEEAPKILDVKKLSPAVQKTVQEQTKGATIRGLSKEVENGKTQYELETKVNGRNRDLLIDPTGKVLEVEEEVDIATLPATIQAEMKKSLGEGKVLLLESVTKDGVLTGYEASVQKGGKKSSVAMGPDGKVLPKAKK